MGAFGIVGVAEQSQKLADGPLPEQSLGQGFVFVDAVAVAPAVFGLVHVSGLHEVGYDAVGVPLFRQSDGFVSYGVARTGKDAFISLSTWETRAQADAATTTAADWVKTNGQQQFALRESYVGDLAIDTGSPNASIAR